VGRSENYIHANINITQV